MAKKPTSNSVFDFQDYKLFLRNLMPAAGPTRGIKSKLAAALGCQLSFLSVALSKPNIHLSLEHGKAACEFFHLDTAETAYFMLLLSRAKAGSKTLEKFYQEQIEAVTRERQEVKSRIQKKTELTTQDQAVYYSDWLLSALHMVLRNEKKLDMDDVSKRLNVPRRRLDRALRFFVEAGLVEMKAGRPIVKELRLHIDDESPWLTMHHRNWRQRAIGHLDHRSPEDLNYTMITSVSEEVAQEIRQFLLEAIQRAEPLIKSAPDQVVYNLNLDFLKVF